MSGKVEGNKVDKLVGTLEKYILDKPKEMRKQAKADADEMGAIITKLKILKKYRETTPTSDLEKKELSKILCFNNLGYCCKKECSWRNAVLEICGISEGTFEVAKEMLGFKLMIPAPILICTKDNVSEKEIIEINRKI